MCKKTLLLLSIFISGVSLIFICTKFTAKAGAQAKQEQGGIERQASDLYKVMSNLSMGERRTIFRGLSSEMKS